MAEPEFDPRQPGYIAFFFCHYSRQSLAITFLSKPTYSEDLGPLLLQMKKFKPREENQLSGPKWSLVELTIRTYTHTTCSFLNVGQIASWVGGGIDSMTPYTILVHQFPLAAFIFRGLSIAVQKGSFCWFEGKWNNSILFLFCH